MMLVEQTEWKSFYDEANDFFKAAYNAFEKKKFTNDTLYNIICMSIEKYFVAFLINKGEMPGNHTLSGLVEEVKLQYSISEEIIKNVHFIDTFQDICIIDPVERKEPSQQEMQRMVLALVDIKEWVSASISESECLCN